MKQDNSLEPANVNRDCEAVGQLVAAYSIGMTNPDETAFVESHLADCPEAAAELAEYRMLARKLMFSAPPMKAPAQLRQRLLETVKSGQAAPSSSELEESRQHTSFWTSVKRMLMEPVSAHLSRSLLAVALLLLIVSNLSWVARFADFQEQVNARFADYDGVLALVSAEDTQRIVLRAEGSDARADMLCNPDDKLGFLYAEDLPVLPANQVYQVWLVRGEQRTSAGVFQVDEDGEGMLIIRASLPMRSYEAVQVTQEQEGGSRQPTTEPVIAGHIRYS